MSKKSIFILVGLLVFGSLFFVPAALEIWADFDLPQFFEHPFFTVLFLLLFGIFLRFVLQKYKQTEFIFISDALITVSLIGMLIEVPHIKRFFTNTVEVSVDGEWFYQVQDSKGINTHGGICTIKQSHDGTLIIEGWRKYKQLNDNETVLERTAGNGIHWFTDENYAVLHGGETKWVDFVYRMVTDEHQIRGYCHLQVKGGGKPTELVGTYTHLAPDKLTGDIMFTKMTQREAEEHIKTVIEGSKNLSKQYIHEN